MSNQSGSCTNSEPTAPPPPGPPTAACPFSALDQTSGNGTGPPRPTRISLEESESRFRAFAEATSDAIISADASGAIVSWNRSAAHIFGYTEDEMPGRPLTSLMPERFRQAHTKGLLNYKEGASRVIGRTVELQGLRKGGVEFPIELSLCTWTTSGGRFFTGIIRDITERKRNEAVLALLVTERMAEARGESFHLIADQAPALLWMSDATGRPVFYNAACLAFTGHTLEEALAGRWVEAVHPDDAAAALETFRSSFGTRQPFSMEYRLRRADGEYRWVLDTGIPRFDSAGVLEGYVGSSLDINDRKQREREQEALLALARALRAADSPTEIVPIVLDQITILLAADGSSLALRDGPKAEVRVELARGVWASWSGAFFSEEEALTSRVIMTSQPYLCNDISSDPELSINPRMIGLTAVAGVPLIDRETVGALWIGRRAPITSEELRLLLAIADMTATALRRSGLHEETVRRLRQITALRAGQAAISASLDLPFTLNALIEQLISIVDVDAAAVLLLNPQTSRLEYAAGHGFRSSLALHTTLRLGEGEAGRAALERRSRHIPNLMAMKSDLVRKWLVDEEGFVNYHAIPLVSQNSVQGLLEVFHREPRAPNADWNTFVRMLASQASVAIDHATMFDRVHQANDELRMAYDTTLEGWSAAMDLRDKETEGHTRRVARMTERLARAMGVGEEELRQIRRGALLHDIGKIGIPDRILLKPGPLDDEEWEIMRRHPVYAYELLSPIAFLKPALDIPYCHHERWDGTGYPRGLKGEEIPLAARIFAVVDVWDALRSDRPYRVAWSEERTLDQLRKGAGSHFEPRIVDLFLEVLAGGLPEAPASAVPHPTGPPAVALT